MAIVAILILIVLVLTLFLAIVVGLRQAHPTDLAVQRPTLLAGLAGRIVGLHVRRPESLVATPADDYDRAGR